MSRAHEPALSAASGGVGRMTDGGDDDFELSTRGHAPPQRPAASTAPTPTTAAAGTAAAPAQSLSARCGWCGGCPDCVIPIPVSAALTPVLRVHLVQALFNFLLYQQQQIPMPYDELIKLRQQQIQAQSQPQPQPQPQQLSTATPSASSTTAVFGSGETIASASSFGTDVNLSGGSRASSHGSIESTVNAMIDDAFGDSKAPAEVDGDDDDGGGGDDSDDDNGIELFTPLEPKRRRRRRNPTNKPQPILSPPPPPLPLPTAAAARAGIVPAQLTFSPLNPHTATAVRSGSGTGCATGGDDDGELQPLRLQPTATAAPIASDPASSSSDELELKPLIVSNRTQRPPVRGVRLNRGRGQTRGGGGVQFNRNGKRARDVDASAGSGAGGATPNRTSRIPRVTRTKPNHLAILTDRLSALLDRMFTAFGPPENADSINAELQACAIVFGASAFTPKLAVSIKFLPEPASAPSAPPLHSRISTPAKANGPAAAAASGAAVASSSLVAQTPQPHGRHATGTSAAGAPLFTPFTPFPPSTIKRAGAAAGLNSAGGGGGGVLTAASFGSAPFQRNRSALSGTPGSVDHERFARFREMSAVSSQVLRKLIDLPVLEKRVVITPLHVLFCVPSATEALSANPPFTLRHNYRWERAPKVARPQKRANPSASVSAGPARVTLLVGSPAAIQAWNDSVASAATTAVAAAAGSTVLTSASASALATAAIGGDDEVLLPLVLGARPALASTSTSASASQGANDASFWFQYPVAIRGVK